MKNKVVVWGTNAENEKVLIALELQAEANKVMLYTFPEAIAPEVDAAWTRMYTVPSTPVIRVPRG